MYYRPGAVHYAYDQRERLADGRVRAKAHQSLTRGTGEVFHVEMEVFHCLPTRKRPPRGHTGAGFLRRPNYKLRSRMPVRRD